MRRPTSKSCPSLAELHVTFPSPSARISDDETDEFEGEELDLIDGRLSVDLDQASDLAPELDTEEFEIEIALQRGIGDPAAPFEDSFAETQFHEPPPFQGDESEGLEDEVSELESSLRDSTDDAEGIEEPLDTFELPPLAEADPGDQNPPELDDSEELWPS